MFFAFILCHMCVCVCICICYLCIFFVMNALNFIPNTAINFLFLHIKVQFFLAKRMYMRGCCVYIGRKAINFNRMKNLDAILLLLQSLQIAALFVLFFVSNSYKNFIFIFLYEIFYYKKGVWLDFIILTPIHNEINF